MHPVIERRLSIALAAICVAAVIIAIAPWLIDPARLLAGPVAAPRGDATASAPALGEMRPLDSFASFTARPLFAASRRPAPTALASRGDTGAPFQQGQIILGRYRLTGIVVSPKVRIAFVTDITSNKSIAVTEGEKLGEWEFTEITRDSITMQSDGRRKVVAFKAQPEKPAAGR